jgi:hypothetical protein
MITDLVRNDLSHTAQDLGIEFMCGIFVPASASNDFDGDF